MAGNIKGLTVEIGGDTTKLGKALESVNKQSRNLSSELGQINRLLKFDPGNADLLAQKQDILADAVENTSKKLETLKEAERQVQAQFERGEVSADQVRALQREIVDTEQKLNAYKNAAKETAEAIDDLGKKSGRTAQETADLKNKLADVAGAGLKGIGTAVGAAATALTAAAETTRDYRMEMGKLDTAFTDNGFSSQAATGAYKELVGVLGEYDQSVEAANHLAKLTSNEQELATWTGDILPGVFATFGDSLPIEGLTEAANETAKVGQVTGPLADALNWAGISEDKFNESLAKCTTEQERQKLIMETLSGVYGEASAKYKETNADVIAANQANDAWTASLAQVGAAVEPVLTSVKNMGAELLSNMVPAIQAILNNLPAIGVILAGTAAAFVAFKVAAMAATAATQGMTLAQKAAAAAQAALNVVMSANPIGIVILAITALVAAFMLLWNNSESFREFWINLWEKIKTAALNAADNLKQLPDKIYNAIQDAVNRVQKWGSDLVNRAKTAATNMLNNVVNTLKNIPSKVTSSISGAISAVTTWGSNMVSKAKSAMSNLVSGVVSTLSDLPSKFTTMGKNIIQGLINGITGMLGSLYSSIKQGLSGLVDKAKNALGINSPSKVFADEVGAGIPEGIAMGIEDHMDDPVKAVQHVNSGMLRAAGGEVGGIQLERRLTQTAAATVPTISLGGGVVEKLDRILVAIQEGKILTIDGNALVGATAGRFDSTLGQRRALAARGAL
jgi:phage-related minor tail protein